MDTETKQVAPSDLELLTVHEVAALLKTSIRQLQNMRHRGQFPPATVIPGLGPRYTPSQVRAWLADTTASDRSGAKA